MPVYQPFEIEPGTIDDLGVLHTLERRAHISPWSRAMLRDSLSSNHLCWKLSIDNQICAYLITMKALDELELLNIVVAPAKQGLGLGEHLMQHLNLFATENNFMRIFLEVRASNFAAIHLYKKSGFKQVGLRRNYYPALRGGEDALVMRLIL